VIALDTARGTIEFETYPEEAPKTVARIVELVRQGFYDGQRFHRAEPDFLVQIGDPASRDVSRQEWWGRTGTGKPLGAAEITKKRTNVAGAVGMAYAGNDPKRADSQFYLLLKTHPELDERYAVFGRVIAGMDVASRIRRGDLLRKAYVKAAS
jgi:cyclophilin family peptidyl-prolyl cis-trans isomerase